MSICKNIWLLIGVFAATFFVACNGDDDQNDSTPIVVNSVYLEDTESAVPDREVTFARIGQLLRIEGSGFTGMREIYINGYSTYFNPVYVSDNNLLVQVGKSTPTIDADDSVRNTIRFVKLATDLVYDFDIRDAAPTVNRISNTLPVAGEQITLYGSGLVEIEKVTFPGDVVVTSGFESDIDGEFVIVTVPEGIIESGAIFVEGANGGAYSPAYFNFTQGIILNFDGIGQQGFWGWSETGSMIDDTDLSSELIGVGNVSQGTYVPHRPARLATLPQGKNRLTEVWTAGSTDDWRGQLTPYIPAETPVSEVAFQFDIYVPVAWSNTGFLKICLHNSFNGGEWAGDAYNYVPWIVDKKVVPFITEGWVTVTVPLNKFYSFSDPEKEFTFEDVLAAREGASYKNFGFYFENSDFTLANITGNSSDATELVSSPTSVSVYTDNWRIVPNTKPVYTDFPVEVIGE